VRSSLKGQDIQEILIDISNKFKNLQSLSLAITERTNFTHIDIGNIASSISLNLMNLKHLHLNFSKCPEISGQALEMLSSRTFSVLKRLESVSLNFSNCTFISDTGLKAFCLSIKNHSLENLSLNFAGCSRISDKGIAFLIDNISSFKNLESLNLNFYECYLITNDCAHNLSSSILQNDKKCDNITDQGIKPLIHDLATLKLLQVISLKFYGCSEISFDGVTKLIDNLAKNFSHLQTLALNFDCFDEMEEEELNTLKDKLDFAQNVQLSFD